MIFWRVHFQSFFFKKPCEINERDTLTNLLSFQLATKTNFGQLNKRVIYETDVLYKPTLYIHIYIAKLNKLSLQNGSLQ